MLLLEVLKSKYCQIVFVISLVIGYFLVPSYVFSSEQFYFGYIFIFTFALVITCIIRGIKERVLIGLKRHTAGIAGIASILAYLSLQVCGIGGMCISGISVGILSLLPTTFSNFLTMNYEIIFYVSIAIQIFALYYMGCFKKLKNFIK